MSLIEFMNEILKDCDIESIEKVYPNTFTDFIISEYKIFIEYMYEDDVIDIYKYVYDLFDVLDDRLEVFYNNKKRMV